MSFRIATVGHVDHGKSTLIGRLLADTQQTRDDRQAKVASFCASEQRKFEYAFLLDALEEEQSQGITIDVTEVAWKLKNREFTFVDTPGHREFLKKMVGGASRVDAAILMVDVTEGIRDTFRRQVKMLDLLGIQQLIVLVNKMDLVDWREEAWQSCESEILKLFAKFSGRLTVLPASAWHGANLLEASPDMPWYSGPSLSDVLIELNQTESQDAGPTRFLIQDVYRTEEKRIFVGRVESGSLQVGDPLTFFPGQHTTRIKTIEVYQESRTSAQSGDCIGITLEDALFLDRGTLGYSPSQAPQITSSALADLFWLAAHPLRLGDSLLIKSGTRQFHALVKSVINEIDTDTFVEHHDSAQIRLFGRVQLEFKQEVALDRFVDCPSTGRFVACQNGQVLGGGRWAECVAKQALNPRGQVLWFTGLSGAGKSTLARALETELSATGLPVIVLDGDELRQGLCRDLGFSTADRNEHIRRTAEVAKLFSNQGFTVITALISPLESQRQAARKILGLAYREVFVDSPLAICEQRDVKGLYAKARRGEIPDFTGVSAPFELPEAADLHIQTHENSLPQALQMLKQKFITQHQAKDHNL